MKKLLNTQLGVKTMIKRKSKKRLDCFGDIIVAERKNLFKQFDYYRLNRQGLSIVRNHTRPNVRKTVCTNPYFLPSYVCLEWMTKVRNKTADMTFCPRTVSLRLRLKSQRRFIRIA